MAHDDEGLDRRDTRALLQLYLAGDAAGANRLFERHRDTLLEAAQRHPLARAMDGRQSAEDLVDETFLRALSSGFFERFEPRGKGALRGALLTILERVVVDEWRRRKTAKRGGRERIVGLVTSTDAADPSRAAPAGREPTPTSSARAREWLARCEHILTPREWDVWCLVEVEGLTPGEVAAERDEPAATIRGVLRRARERLFETFGAAPADDSAR
ncbi:MAG: sigma-70 family RNA polymerase sigma factor [Planctomycetes bacterium]|nr:sigma-70 family RNA polymerase sigma factor [Planctomycetota bacterium]